MKKYSKIFDKDKYMIKYSKKLYEVVGDEYILTDIIRDDSHRTLLKLIHTVCGCEYIVDQSKFFNQKHRCQNANCKHERFSIMRTKTDDKFKEEIYNLTRNEYKLISRYKGTNINVTFLHEKCQNTFDMTPHNFLSGQRCPICANISRRSKITKTNDQYIEDVRKLFGDEYTILGNYTKARDKILVKHNICGHLFNITAYKMLLLKNPCHYCETPTNGEQRIINYLDKVMFGKYNYQKSFNDLLGVKGGKLSYDFYIPQYNLLIEYQGEYHDGNVSIQTEEQLKIQKEHDRRKREYANSHGIDLLEIWYYDFDNIEKILKEKLNI